MTAALVLDASLTLSWALPDEASKYSDVILSRVAESGALVPGRWPHVVGNGLLMAQRRGRCTAAQCRAYVDALMQLPIEVAATSARDIFEGQTLLAERFGLTVYDAAYLNLALKRGLPLATQDKAMKGPARKAGVLVA
jgi:predicted nucleic acid-binding protein